MGRKNNPVPNGLLVYAGYMRKTRQILRIAENRARKRNQIEDARLTRKLTRREQYAVAMARRMDRIERNPSKLGASQLYDIAKNCDNPPDMRLRASAILLKWADGDLSYGKRRRQPGGGNQTPGP